jgi:hypothetical protein
MEGKIQELLGKAESAEENDATVNGSKRLFGSEADAAAFYELKRPGLSDLDSWNESSSLSSYSLFDETGRELPRTELAEGDLIRISLKGSGKYDWVKVISLRQSADEAVVTVSPAADPTDHSGDKATTSHFFSGDATNNFCLRLNGRAVEFFVIGFTEKTNIGETGGPVESIRNLAVANLGSYLGIQSSEWTKFSENFLKAAGD